MYLFFKEIYGKGNNLSLVRALKTWPFIGVTIKNKYIER